MANEIIIRDFVRNPDIALTRQEWLSGNYKAMYAYNYEALLNDVNSKKADIGVLRDVIQKDIWFILYFCLELPEDVLELANTPFVVNYASEIQKGPIDYTLDLVAREHFKSTLITISETIQYILKYPEKSNCIFSYARHVAKSFLRIIKQVFEKSELLKVLFSDVLYRNPEKEAPKWSEDDGLIVKRKSARKESTVEAWGLVEGMPTGKHFDRRIYDDIVTEDIAESVDILDKVKRKFDSSQNLGVMEGGCHRVVGTFYHHADPLVYIMGLKKPDGTNAYYVRKKPATVDGTFNGKPVLLPEERLEMLKLYSTFACQQLLDPTPEGMRRLESKFLQEIDPEMIPSDIYKFMLIDPAGDDKDGKGDAWAIIVVGVSPNTDDIGASSIYITNAIISPMRETEAIEAIARMYCSSGVIERIGVEKVGLSSVEVHVANALEKMGRRISIDDGTLVSLKPAGRSKQKRIESALAWPLFNSKIHISKSIAKTYRDRLMQELDSFPYWHDDCLDALSYLYDIISDFRFISHKEFYKKLNFNTAGVV